jgi:hypothetical protein
LLERGIGPGMRADQHAERDDYSGGARQRKAAWTYRRGAMPDTMLHMRRPLLGLPVFETIVAAALFVALLLPVVAWLRSLLK